MFHKSRRKIIATIMGVLTGLFVITLCVIYFSSYIEVYQKDREMMVLYAEKYWVNGNPEDTGNVLGAKPGGSAKLKLRSSNYIQSFYSVLLDSEKQVLDVNNEKNSGLSDAFFAELVEEILNLNKETGIHGNWIYHVETNQEADNQEADNQETCNEDINNRDINNQDINNQETRAVNVVNSEKTLVVLIDNTVMNQNIHTLFQYTAIFGGIALILLFILSVYLSKKIVSPLEENDRRQRQFLSDVSHELKTPLAVMNTNMEMLEREIGVHPWLTNMREENVRMKGLVHQLLYLARAESAQVPKERVDFGRVVMGTVLTLESMAFEKHIEINFSAVDELFVLGNQEQLQQLASTLIENAVSHSDPWSEIWVTLERQQGKLQFCVENAGEAFNEEQKKAIFERFYRTDFSRNSDSGHYGLGLAIAKTITIAHQGAIEVQCKNQKIIFQVLLPTCL